MRLLKSEYIQLNKVKQLRDLKTAPDRPSPYPTPNEQDDDILEVVEEKVSEPPRSINVSPISKSFGSNKRQEAQTKYWDDGEWCAVCHGDYDTESLVYGCETCPKVYHPKCYTPVLQEEPPDDWVCLMCTKDADFEAMPNKPKKTGTMGERDLNFCRRIVLEMYYQWPESTTFRSLSDLQFPLYTKTIKRPIALDAVKTRLNTYHTVSDFEKDVKTMFSNCRTFWEGRGAQGPTYLKHAKKLEAILYKNLDAYKSKMLIHDSWKEKESETVQVNRPGPASRKLQKDAKVPAATESSTNKESASVLTTHVSRGKEKKSSKAVDAQTDSDEEGISKKSMRNRPRKTKRGTSEPSSDIEIISDDEGANKHQNSTSPKDSDNDEEFTPNSKRKQLKKNKHGKKSPKSNANVDEICTSTPRPSNKKRKVSETNTNGKNTDYSKKRKSKEGNLTHAQSDSSSDERESRKPGPASRRRSGPASRVQSSRRSSKISHISDDDEEGDKSIESFSKNGKKKKSEPKKDDKKVNEIPDNESPQKEQLRQCKYCDAVYDKIDKMKDHALNHFEKKLSAHLPTSKPFDCPFDNEIGKCNEEFSNWNDLFQHYACEHYCTEEDLGGSLVNRDLIDKSSTEKDSEAEKGCDTNSTPKNQKKKNSGLLKTKKTIGSLLKSKKSPSSTRRGPDKNKKASSVADVNSDEDIIIDVEEIDEEKVLPKVLNFEDIEVASDNELCTVYENKDEKPSSIDIKSSTTKSNFKAGPASKKNKAGPKSRTRKSAEVIPHKDEVAVDTEAKVDDNLDTFEREELANVECLEVMDKKTSNTKEKDESSPPESGPKSKRRSTRNLGPASKRRKDPSKSSESIKGNREDSCEVVTIIDKQNDSTQLSAEVEKELLDSKEGEKHEQNTPKASRKNKKGKESQGCQIEPITQNLKDNPSAKMSKTKASNKEEDAENINDVVEEKTSASSRFKESIEKARSSTLHSDLKDKKNIGEEDSVFVTETSKCKNNQKLEPKPSATSKIKTPVSTSRKGHKSPKNVGKQDKRDNLEKSRKSSSLSPNKEPSLGLKKNKTPDKDKSLDQNKKIAKETKTLSPSPRRSKKSKAGPKRLKKDNVKSEENESDNNIMLEPEDQNEISSIENVGEDITSDGVEKMSERILKTVREDLKEDSALDTSSSRRKSRRTTKHRPPQDGIENATSTKEDIKGVDDARASNNKQKTTREEAINDLKESTNLQETDDVLSASFLTEVTDDTLNNVSLTGIIDSLNVTTDKEALDQTTTSIDCNNANKNKLQEVNDDKSESPQKELHDGKLIEDTKKICKTKYGKVESNTGSSEMLLNSDAFSKDVAYAGVKKHTSKNNKLKCSKIEEKTNDKGKRKHSKSISKYPTELPDEVERSPDTNNTDAETSQNAPAATPQSKIKKSKGQGVDTKVSSDDDDDDAPLKKLKFDTFEVTKGIENSKQDNMSVQDDNVLKKESSDVLVDKKFDSLEAVQGENTKIQKVVESKVENEKKLTATPQSSIKRPGPSSTKKPGPASSKRPGPASSKRPGPASRCNQTKSIVNREASSNTTSNLPAEKTGPLDINCNDPIVTNKNESNDSTNFLQTQNESEEAATEASLESNTEKLERDVDENANLKENTHLDQKKPVEENNNVLETCVENKKLINELPLHNKDVISHDDLPNLNESFEERENLSDMNTSLTLASEDFSAFNSLPLE